MLFAKSILSLMAVKELNFPVVCSADRSTRDLVAASYEFMVRYFYRSVSLIRHQQFALNGKKR